MIVAMRSCYRAADLTQGVKCAATNGMASAKLREFRYAIAA